MYGPLLPFRDAGRFLGYTGKSSGKTSVHQHCKEGRLTKVKIRGRSFITQESAERLIRKSIVSQGNAGARFEKEAEK